MAFTNLGHFTAGSLPQAMCGIPSTTHIALASNSTFLQIWDLSTQSQVGSNISGIASGSVWDIEYAGNNKLACMTNATTAYLVDLGGTVTSLTSMQSAYSTGHHQQQIAAIPSSNIAVGCTSSIGQIVKFDANAVSASLVTVPWLGGQSKVLTVVAKDTTGFIFATDYGMIVETDTSLNLVKSYQIPPLKRLNLGSNTLQAQVGVALAYYNGYLLVGTSKGQTILFNHNTETELQRQTGPRGNQQEAVVVFSRGSSDQCVLMGGGFGNTGGQVVELDILMTPIFHKSAYFVDTATLSSSSYFLGLNGTNGYVCNNSTRVDCFSISGKRAITFQDFNLKIGGVQVPSECIVLDDSVSPGVGPAKVLFATDAPASGNQKIPFTTGMGTNAAIKWGRNGTGASEVADIRRTTV